MKSIYPLDRRFRIILVWWVFLLARGCFLVHALLNIFTFILRVELQVNEKLSDCPQLLVYITV